MPDALSEARGPRLSRTRYRHSYRAGKAAAHSNGEESLVSRATPLMECPAPPARVLLSQLNCSQYFGRLRLRR